MSTPIDPEFETEVLAAIREPLVAAITGADARANARTRSYRLLAAACVCVLIAGGAVAVWRSNRGGDTSPQIRVGPTTSLPSPTTSPHSIVGVCDGNALSLTGSGASPGDGMLSWYLDLRNDSSAACAVPHPTAASVIDSADRRVGLAGIDHIVGAGPPVDPGATTRLILSTAAVCAQSGQPPSLRYRYLVVMVGGRPIAAPLVELMLCDQGVAVVRFEPPPPAHSVLSDPKAVNIGVTGDSTIYLRNVPFGIGSGIGNGVTVTSDRRFLAYEYGERIIHQVATVDIETCATQCTETVLGHGHSPVYSSDGRLAYVALDSAPPAGEAEATWKRIGSVTVRAPDGTTQQWARGAGMQTVAWAGDTLLVAHDVPRGQSEGFEELWLYRGPGDRTILTQGLVAISPDGTRLLLTGNGTDQLLELYDVESQRAVSSISIADYERALVPARELVGVDLTKWPGHDETMQWPISCCVEGFSGATLWHDDLVLFPMTRHITHRTNGDPDQWEPRPTLLRIVGDRIVPLRTLQVVGTINDYYAARWVPESNTEFVLKRSGPNPPFLVRCKIEGPRASCYEDPSAETVFRLPATYP